MDSEQEVEVDEGDPGDEASGDENQPSTSAPIPPRTILPPKKNTRKHHQMMMQKQQQPMMLCLPM